MSDEREMLAEVREEIRAASLRHFNQDQWGEWRLRPDAIADDVLASPQFARLIAAAKGEALREAADRLNTTDHATEMALSGVDHVIDWLRDRAALTAEPAPTEGEGA